MGFILDTYTQFKGNSFFTDDSDLIIIVAFLTFILILKSLPVINTWLNFTFKVEHFYLYEFY
jgi:hypothetical protein